jgi:hypothetical protein
MPLQGLATAVEKNPKDFEKLYEAVTTARAEGLGVVEQVVRLARESKIQAAARGLKADANDRAHDLAHASDDYEFDWEKALFITIMIITL